MINAEKYKDKILEMKDDNYWFSIDKRDNQFKSCVNSECSKCLINTRPNDESCRHAQMEWLLSEYKEKIILSELEYVILKFIHKEGFKYIARDKDGNLFAFRFKPKKSGDIWDCDIKYNISYANDLIIFNKLLKFVKWEDTEPRSIEELLKNCEVADK